MSVTELEELMQQIRSGRINECLGCLAWKVASYYLQICDTIFEKATLELLEHHNPAAQYPAYVVLCRCSDRLSAVAIEKINSYKKDPHHKRILREAQRKDCVSPDLIQ